MAAVQPTTRESTGIGGELPDMDEGQFRQWADLLESRTGTVLPPERKSFLVTSIAIRMREIGCGCYQEYFDRLLYGSGGLAEWFTLVDRLTVHETRFFRHPTSLQLVHDDVVASQKRNNGGAASYQVWSVGCSTGEEVYTLGMVVDRALSESGTDGYFGITGTDISQASLNFARRGVYSGRRIRDIEPCLIDEYFEPTTDGRHKVCERLRSRTCFARMNALEIGNQSIGALNLIYCQNVLIYFERARRHSIVNGLVDCLVPGGMLILGSGELVGWSDSRMDRVACGHTLAYRRSG